jgi:hypothetical protein
LFKSSRISTELRLLGRPYSQRFIGSVVLEEFGSDGWNRTIDLGVMNPNGRNSAVLIATITNKNRTKPKVF